MSESQTKLHLDADASSKILHKSLLNRGYDVTRTPNEWVSADASDEQQLESASSQGRVIFTFNIGDFQFLARIYTDHAGILLASQKSFTLSELIDLLDKTLSTTTPKDWIGQVRWLSEWREAPKNV